MGNSGSRDIPEKRVADEALRKNEEHYRLLFDNAGEAIISHDSELILTDINRIGCELIGYGREELLGKNILELGILHPDDVENAANTIRRHFDGEDITEAEYTFIRKDGAERLVTVTNASIRDPDGNLQSITNICRDVTEERRVEEALRRTQFTVDHSADSVFWVTSTGKIIFANDEACRRRGYTREEILSLTIFDINDSFAADNDLWESCVERIQREGHFAIEYRHRTKGGEVFPVEAMLNFFGLDGDWLFVANVRDITDRKAAEEALKRTNEELDGYAHIVSHDLKGPLTAAGTAIDVIKTMRERPPTDDVLVKVNEMLDIVARGVSRATTMTEDLLTLAQVGQSSATHEPVNISEVVRSILQEKEAPLEERDGRVSVDDDLGVAGMDPTHAYQLFANLVGNAIKYNDSDNPEMRISRLVEAGPGRLRYAVRDNGPGIPDGEMENIFLPFHKGAGSTGTGIGLSIVDKVVKLYGGQIRAYNGGGACFEFTLPIYSSQGP